MPEEGEELGVGEGVLGGGGRRGQLEGGEKPAFGFRGAGPV